MKDIEMLAFLQGNKKKTALIAAIAIVIVVVVILVAVKFKEIKGLIVDHNANQKLVDELNKEIKADDITHTQLQFQAYVSKLLNAMNGWGTDEKKIYDVFNEMNTRSDVLQLIKTFGVQKDQNLNEWIADDCSASEISHINEILASKNINYQF